MTNDATTKPVTKLAPIRLRIPKLLDVVVISDPEQMQWLNQHVDVVRPLDPTASFLHKLLDQRLRVDLGFAGGLLPVFRPRSEAARADTQKKLFDRLESLRGAPGEERDDLAQYVSGEKHVDEIGLTVQQWCGRLFVSHYCAFKETYEAGRLIASWPSAPPWRTWLDRRNGKLARAKSVLEHNAEGDLHCIHATTIGMENVARSVRNLRGAAQSHAKQKLSPDDILRECLVAPPAVLRGCAREIDVPFLNQPLTRQSVVVFLVARAFAASGDFDVAFLTDGWSACPAREVIPEMLRSVWYAAHNEEVEEQHLHAKINTWTRLWHRAVS